MKEGLDSTNIVGDFSILLLIIDQTTRQKVDMEIKYLNIIKQLDLKHL